MEKSISSLKKGLQPASQYNANLVKSLKKAYKCIYMCVCVYVCVFIYVYILYT